MKKQLISRFHIFLVGLTSIYALIAINILSFIDPRRINSDGSWFITSIRFADLLALTLIAFTVIILITVNFIDKIASKMSFIIAVIFTGFCFIYAGLTWNWQFYFLTFFLSNIGIGFLIPISMRLIFQALPSDKRRLNYIRFIILYIVGWVFISALIFIALAIQFWRYIYIIIGIISIISSFLIISFEGLSEMR